MGQKLFTFSDIMSLVAIVASLSALVLSLKEGQSGQTSTKILIYDREEIAEQISPYILGGADPLGVIDQAISRATDAGFFVIGSDQNLKGPEAAKFRLEHFVLPPAPLQTRGAENG